MRLIMSGFVCLLILLLLLAVAVAVATWYLCRCLVFMLLRLRLLLLLLLLLRLLLLLLRPVCFRSKGMSKFTASYDSVANVRKHIFRRRRCEPV